MMILAKCYKAPCFNFNGHVMPTRRLGPKSTCHCQPSPFRPFVVSSFIRLNSGCCGTYPVSIPHISILHEAYPEDSKPKSRQGIASTAAFINLSDDRYLLFYPPRFSISFLALSTAKNILSIHSQDTIQHPLGGIARGYSSKLCVSPIAMIPERVCGYSTTNPIEHLRGSSSTTASPSPPPFALSLADWKASSKPSSSQQPYLKRINYFIDKREYSKALSIFDEMWIQQIVPSTLSCILFAKALSHLGQVQNAYHYLKKIKGLGSVDWTSISIPPTLTTAMNIRKVSAVDGCLHLDGGHHLLTPIKSSTVCDVQKHHEHTVTTNHPIYCLPPTENVINHHCSSLSNATQDKSHCQSPIATTFGMHSTLNYFNWAMDKKALSSLPSSTSLQLSQLDFSGPILGELLSLWIQHGCLELAADFLLNDIKNPLHYEFLAVMKGCMMFEHGKLAVKIYDFMISRITQGNLHFLPLDVCHYYVITLTKISTLKNSMTCSASSPNFYGKKRVNGVQQDSTGITKSQAEERLAMFYSHLTNSNICIQRRTYYWLMKHWSTMHQYKKVILVYEAMMTDPFSSKKIDLPCYNMVLNAYAILRDLEPAKKLFKAIKSNPKIQIDTALYNTMLKALSFGGDAIGIWKLVHEMIVIGMPPKTLVKDSHLNALSHGKSETKVTIWPTEITMSILLDYLGRHEPVQEVVDFFNSIETRFKIIPSLNNWCTLIELLTSRNNYEEAFNYFIRLIESYDKKITLKECRLLVLFGENVVPLYQYPWTRISTMNRVLAKGEPQALTRKEREMWILMTKKWRNEYLEYKNTERTTSANAKLEDERLTCNILNPE